MASLNRVEIIGRLGRDPELKYSQSGAAICRLNVATDESYTDREGNRVQKAEWHSVVVFQKAAEHCSQYLSKGSLVFVEGSLSTRDLKEANPLVCLSLPMEPQSRMTAMIAHNSTSICY